MPRKIYDMLDLPPLEKCYFDVPPTDVAKNKPLGRINDVLIMVNNNLVVNGFHVTRTRGTTRWTQRFECRGLNVGDLGSQQNTVMEALRHRMHNALQRGRRQALPSFRALMVR
jgi:hypothetical protein